MRTIVTIPILIASVSGLVGEALAQFPGYGNKKKGMQLGAVYVREPRTGKLVPYKPQKLTAPKGQTQIGAVSFWNPRTRRYEVPPGPKNLPPARPGTFRTESPNAMIERARKAGLVTPGYQRGRYKLTKKGRSFTKLNYSKRKVTPKRRAYKKLRVRKWDARRKRWYWTTARRPYASGRPVAGKRPAGFSVPARRRGLTTAPRYKSAAAVRRTRLLAAKHRAARKRATAQRAKKRAAYKRARTTAARRRASKARYRARAKAAAARKARLRATQRRAAARRRARYGSKRKPAYKAPRGRGTSPYSTVARNRRMAARRRASKARAARYKARAKRRKTAKAKRKRSAYAARRARAAAARRRAAKARWKRSQYAARRARKAAARRKAAAARRARYKAAAARRKRYKTAARRRAKYRARRGSWKTKSHPGAGIVSGFTGSPSKSGKIVVESGMTVDAAGRDLLLRKKTPVDLNQLLPSGP